MAASALGDHDFQLALKLAGRLAEIRAERHQGPSGIVSALDTFTNTIESCSQCLIVVNAYTAVSTVHGLGLAQRPIQC